MIIWLQGAFVEAGEARIDPADRGLLLGDGVFDTFRITSGVPHHLDAHLARLRAAADVFGMPLPFSDAEADAAARELSARNGLPEAAARLTVTRGQGQRGLLPPDPASPLVMMATAPRAAPPAPRLMISDVVRYADALTSRHKTLSYIANIEARRRAALAGFDDAVMLNERGEVVCASAANVFWIRGGRLYTPALDCGALPGVTRAHVLELAAGLGARAEEGRYGPEALLGAEAAFLTNSVAGVVPVRGLASPQGEAAFDPEAGMVAAISAAERSG